AAPSPDGGTLATGTGDGLVMLWDIPAAAPRAELRHHRGAVQQPVWSPDGQHLATASAADGTVAVWSADGRKLGFVADYQFNLTAQGGVSFAPAGRVVLIPNQAGLRVIDVASGRVVQHLMDAVHFGPGLWSPDGRSILTYAGPFANNHWPLARWEQAPGGGG